MTFDFSHYEAGKPYAGDYAADLEKLQRRLSHIHYAHIVHKRRAAIVFEGWDAAGKGGIIKRLTAEWDPRYFEVWPIAAPTPEEAGRHFLWRFWQRLPAQHMIAVFDRSWYGRVLVERVEGFASEAEWRHAYEEINNFEAQHAASGTTIVKLFLHVTQATQDRRLHERVEHPWKRWKITPDDFRNRSRRPEYLAAIEEMFHRTDTAEAPWIVVDGNDKKAARIAALTAIADRLEANVSMKPPKLDPEVAKLAKEAWG